MDKALIQVKIDRRERDRAKKVLADIGLDVTTAVGIFLRAVSRHRKIPFSLDAMDPHDIYTPADRKRIQKAADEVARGEVYTLDEVKSRYKIR